MNPAHIQILCSRLELGLPRGRASSVHGGFHHRMWRLETDRQAFAIKQLSADADTANPEIVHHYDVSERVAETFANQGIGAIAALPCDGDYLQIVERTGYLVYPWSDAVALDRKQIDEEHALKIARLLAKMHGANIRVPGVKRMPFHWYPDEGIAGLARRAGECQAPCAVELNAQLTCLLEINGNYRAGKQVLEEHVLIGHGDMDQKNVLWDAAGSPLIIDWESARKLNPSYEVINGALDWSGISSEFEPDLFGRFLRAYQEAGGAIDSRALQASFHCILGDWLTWLLYIVALYLEEAAPEQAASQAEQIAFVLPTILRLHRLAPELAAMAGEITSA